MPNTLWRASSPVAIVTLLVTNLIPLLGVFYWGWDLYTVILLYWAENGVIGFYNVLKMLFARGSLTYKKLSEGEEKLVEWIGKQNLPIFSLIGRLFFIGFFTFHYGVFWIVHGLFVTLFFGRTMGMDAGMLMSGAMGGGMSIGFESLSNLWPRGMWGALGAMFISHGSSFVRNYIGRDEFLTATPQKLMGEPYSRVVILHLTIMGGAFLVTQLQQPIYGLILLIGLKTGVDLWAHLREHYRFQKAEPQTA